MAGSLSKADEEEEAVNKYEANLSDDMSQEEDQFECVCHYPSVLYDVGIFGSG